MPSGALGPAGERQAGPAGELAKRLDSACTAEGAQRSARTPEGAQHSARTAEGALRPRISARRPCLRLTPADRLRKRFEFRRLRDQGRRVHTRSFVLLIARSEHPQARLGLTVSRQVGNAVQRNRVKRLLREAFRQQRSLFPPASDVVAIAKAGCLPLTLREVQRELTQASSALRAAWSRPVRAPGGSRP